MDFLDTELKYLKGVGGARSAVLASELSLSTMRDLAYYFPFRYLDRTRFYRISELTYDMPAVQIRGRFINFAEEGEGLKKRLVGTFYDGEKFMQIVWFKRLKGIKDSYRIGAEYILFGKPQEFRSVYSMIHPEITVWNSENVPQGFQGVYSLSDVMHKKGYTSRLISQLEKNLLADQRLSEATDPLPVEIRERYKLLPFFQSLRELHFPTTPESLRKARERMKFEELFYLELHILRYSRLRGHKIKGFLFPVIGKYFNDFFYNRLPFSLTGAQKRVLREIRGDMRTGRQMNRLLQGDVGSGKTMVAFMSMLMAVDNGCQAALMAPTEILAGQHYECFKGWCESLGLQVRLLTGSTRAKDRREILSGLLSGSVNIVVGTHALIEDKVEFHRLGLAVIDEQHRFGVAQRAGMWRKNSVPPHVLVMTATPIPRTLAMTVYGDLEVSVIDELPPGRKPVTTLLRFDENRQEVLMLMHKELKEGRQIYIVYPLIKENEKLDLKSLEEGYERVCEDFREYRIAYVHGKMKPEEKDYQMKLFSEGTASILVATTVIEVGVNVPNASVMIIENSERFGLSQLHQLRGRVGRGADKSYCILMTHGKIGGVTRKRLGIMTETTDGFLISEADMKLRGPGDMEGTQQSGLAFNLHIADLARDGQILTIAREAADMVLNAHTGLIASEGEVYRTDKGSLTLSDASLKTVSAELYRRFYKKIDWSQIS